MNQLKPVLIEDFNEIKSPSSLQYSPDEKTLAFTLVQPDKENNKYNKNLWIMEENKEALQLTSSGKDGCLFGEDDLGHPDIEQSAAKRMIWKRKTGRLNVLILMAREAKSKPSCSIVSFSRSFLRWYFVLYGNQS